MTYDNWKARNPDDEYWDDAGDDELGCSACNNAGWIEGPHHDHLIPCTECSAELELADLEAELTQAPDARRSGSQPPPNR
jgi:hypothetical protein